MPRIKIKSGPHLYYEQKGRGADLVLIAGLGADHALWGPALNIFSNYFKVLVFDNRRAGRSNSPQGPCTIEAMAEDTLNLMECLSIGRAAVVGHSMGGAILQQMCLTHPSSIDRAILCSSAARLPEPSLLFIQTLAKMREAGVPLELVIEASMPLLYGEDFLKNKANVAMTVKSRLDNPYPQSVEDFRAQVEACQKQDLRQHIHKIRVKTLVVAGRNDLITPPGCSEFIHRQIPDSGMEIIENCGHLPQLEKPEVFSKIVLDYLKTPPENNF